MACSVSGMYLSEELGATDVARANSALLRAVVAILARVMCLGATFLDATELMAHVTSNGSAIHLARLLSLTTGRELLLHLVGESVLLLIVVMLGSSVLWRRVLATGLPASLARLLHAAHRICLDAASHTRTIPMLRGVDLRRRDRDASRGALLEQLRRGLVISPSAPPLGVSCALDRLVQRFESKHVAEVAPAH